MHFLKSGKLILLCTKGHVEKWLNEDIYDLVKVTSLSNQPSIYYILLDNQPKEKIDILEASLLLGHCLRCKKKKVFPCVDVELENIMGPHLLSIRFSLMLYSECNLRQFVALTQAFNKISINRQRCLWCQVLPIKNQV